MNKRNTQTKQAKQSNSNLIFGIINVSIIVGLAVLVVVLIVLSMKKPTKDNDPVKRYEDLTHITLEQYEAILNGETALAPEDYTFSDTYIFIYNPKYDSCTLCGKLNDDIIEKGKKEDRTYNFYVMDITAKENEGMKDKLSANHLPNTPVLLHLYGSELLETNTDELSIKSALTKF